MVRFFLEKSISQLTPVYGLYHDEPAFIKKHKKGKVHFLSLGVYHEAILID